jgi:hypothetical protein
LSGARLAISHRGTLQDIKGILTLVKEKTNLTGSIVTPKK